MTLNIWLILGIALGGVYLLILGWNTLAAALSSMGRTRQRRFPLRRCVLAAAGPSALPLSSLVLACWGWNRDGVFVVFATLWGPSFWASGAVERRMPEPSAAANQTGEAHTT